ncbi:TetR/AcrR family transcriptional regulator [Actinoalloteichus hymeniacidonis]|uniref:Transcriptional regulator, TetR family n=1 Tax=Actinoalloteichus hymeniacidonis TaxID=340345 RepID=A0AAC9HP00_9PSEU|nr:TetR family transcriptional regulator [Actinoalloteichus hymeniacidonis]AOS62767.1 transcriptional regulator, TetR family [Actinoalloteichus hymeniacidonis]MBB5909202.1 AcrR family transcriptional regulator [Actinoalloteichus hymeniacidonis]
MTGSTNPQPEPRDTRRRGRRSGGDTRETLLAAAREVFAERSFEQATVRMIAERAGVDAAMVNHWFGGKDGLFATAVALPFDPGLLIPTVVEGDRAQAPARMIGAFLSIWDAHPGGFAALFHSYSSNEAAAGMLRDALDRLVIGEALARLGVDRASTRAALCASQLVGLGVVRYVLRFEPLAEADPDWVVAAVAPTMYRYLFEELPPDDGGGGDSA